MTTLYQHQKDFLAINPNKSSLVWSCGTGKTRTALEWIKLDYINKKPLIVCPKALKINWYREAERWNVFCVVLTKEECHR